MKEIKLSQGKTALVDDADYGALSSFKWFAIMIGKTCKTWYAVRNKPPKDGLGIIYMHREILNPDGKTLVDHIDRNGLNNQRNNLRIATRSENNANRVARQNGSSKYLGVFLFESKHKNKTYKYWRASIQKDGKKEDLGCFNTEIDAALAYNNAAKMLHGDFANLNVL